MGKTKRNKKKNYTVTGEKVEKLTWDDLANTSNEIKNSLIMLNVKLNNVGEMYKDYIENNEIASKLYNGIALTLNEIVDEYNKAAELHSTKNLDDTRVLYKGYVNENDDNQIQLFMNLSLLYSGIANKLQAFVNTSITSLMTKIEEILEKDKGEDNGSKTNKSDTKQD